MMALQTIPVAETDPIAEMFDAHCRMALTFIALNIRNASDALLNGDAERAEREGGEIAERLEETKAARPQDLPFLVQAAQVEISKQPLRIRKLPFGVCHISPDFLPKGNGRHTPSLIATADETAEEPAIPEGDQLVASAPRRPQGEPLGRRLLTAAELLDLGDDGDGYQIAGLIPTGGIVLLVGGPGAGKTWLGLDTGMRALGRDTSAGAVLYVDAENAPRLLAQRVRALLAGRGTPPPANLHFLPGANLSLTRPDDVAFLSASIAQTGARLVVLDSLIRFLGSANEKDASEIAAAVGELRRLTIVHGCSVLALHHLRKSSMLPAAALEEVRGSGDLAASADTVLIVKGTGGVGNVTVAKSRWCETPPPFSFAVASDGDAVTITTGEPTSTGKKLIEQVVEALVETLRASSAPLSRKELNALLDEREIDASERTVDTALARLRADGRLKAERAGRGSVYALA